MAECIVRIHSLKSDGHRPTCITQVSYPETICEDTAAVLVVMPSQYYNTHTNAPKYVRTCKQAQKGITMCTHTVHIEMH